MAHVVNTRIMSNFLSVCSIMLAVTACASSSVDAEPAEGPALWRIADKDTTIYLFGAADALPPEADWRSEAVVTAFDAADRIILETDESPQAQQNLPQVIQQLGVFRDGRTLSGVLTDAQKEEVGAVTQSFGAPLQALDALKPWLASIQIGALNAQQQGYTSWTSGLAQLREDAVAAGKPVAYLEESRAVLLQTINALPEETHVNMLMTAARQTRDKPTQAAEVVPLYLSGNTDALAERYHGEGQWADEVLYDALLVQRNNAWAARIETLLDLEEGVIFFAVGTGHVLGKDSLVIMLNESGASIIRQ